MYVISSTMKDNYLMEYNRDELLSKDALKLSKNHVKLFGDLQNAKEFLRKMSNEIIFNYPTRRNDNERFKLSQRVKNLKIVYTGELRKR